jgi:nitrogen fixation protein FixH
MTRPFTGWHMFAIIGSMFLVIITVNLTMAFQAVSTFPGLETRNSYVASQEFDAARKRQVALGWDVRSELKNGVLTLWFTDIQGAPVFPLAVEGTFGRATTRVDDQVLRLTGAGDTFGADVGVGKGNWNLRLVATGNEGQTFKRRLVIHAVATNE